MECEYCIIEDAEVFCLHVLNKEKWDVNEMGYCERWGDVKDDYE